ncbi:alpha/beta hydrolase [Bradyrhizobium symbiodeficiens]|uniref:alpha/beta hydrolase n=1 Tax=Bradyrhizobium symbiodeficiens TaxID=1404367 RepID=UPI002FE5C78F
MLHFFTTRGQDRPGWRPKTVWHWCHVALVLTLSFLGAKAAIADANQTRRAMDAEPFEATDNARMKAKFVLFTTNRKVEASAEAAARQTHGGVLKYDNVFKSEPVNGLALGWAKVTYPAHRQIGDQNYVTNSAQQNPLFNFSIVDHKIIPTPDDFRKAIDKLKGEANDRSLLYVPGIDTSFNNGIEALAQLALDLDWRGPPVLFSWPSDGFRLISGTRLFGLSESSYLETSRIALRSSPLLSATINELSSSGVVFDLLAHSMGSEVVVNSLSAQQEVSRLSMAPETIAPSPSMPTLVLAAPDVSTHEFMGDMHPILARRTKHITIYCSNDLALSMSARVRHSDDRLGYCVTPKVGPEGLEIVMVSGTAQDFANHSYYIISPDMLNDVKRALSPDSMARIPGTPGRMREIKLK